MLTIARVRYISLGIAKVINAVPLMGIFPIGDPKTVLLCRISNTLIISVIMHKFDLRSRVIEFIVENIRNTSRCIADDRVLGSLWLFLFNASFESRS